jgi:hypothetical protein
MEKLAQSGCEDDLLAKTRRQASMEDRVKRRPRTAA